MPESFEGGHRSPEKEKKQPILIAFRENNLLTKWSGKVKSILEAAGSPVEMHTFPQGADEAEIENWVKENKELLKGKRLLTDFTVQYNIRPTKKQKIGNLDEFLNQATEASILGSDIDSTEKSREKTGEAIAILVGRILEKQGIKPGKVTIVTDKLMEHSPFVDDYEKERKKYIKKTGTYYGFKVSDVLLQHSVDTIKQWLVSGGVPDEVIKTVPSIDDDNEPEFNQDGHWIIADRHKMWRDKERIHVGHQHEGNQENYEARATTFNLPLDNFYRDALKQGFIDHDESDVEKALEKILYERYANE